MADWYTLLAPLAVLVILSLLGFVGCGFQGTASMTVQPYADDVLQDNPLVYYRMQELFGATTASDETGHINAQYGVAPTPLNNSSYLSLPISSPGQQVGVGSVMPKDPSDKSVRFNGSFITTQGQVPIGDQVLQQFTVDALVHPEWDIANERDFYCVVDCSIFVPGLGSPGPNRNAGFAIYAGPDNPLDPNSPICWQLWIGTGNEFARANPRDGSPGPLVLAEDTYLAVQFGDTQAFLWAFTVNADLDHVQHEVIRRPYVQPIGAWLNTGISQNFAALMGPFPGSDGFIYPIVGRIAEVAVYNTFLDQARIISHIMNAFNTT